MTTFEKKLNRFNLLKKTFSVYFEKYYNSLHLLLDNLIYRWAVLFTDYFLVHRGERLVTKKNNFIAQEKGRKNFRLVSVEPIKDGKGH